MMILKISRLVIEHFKGITGLAITPNGENMLITGQNGAGKTSMYLAYLWVLGQNVGEVTPITPAGSPLVQTAVEVTFLTKAGNFVKFKRVLAGKDNQYFINDNLVNTKAEYQRYILNITHAPVEIVSKLGYFCNMKDNDMRNILMQMCSVSDGDVIATDETLKPLANVGNIVAYKDKVKFDIKSLKAELQGIPSEIKGLSFNMQQLGDKNIFNDELVAKSAELEQLNDEIAVLQKDTPEDKTKSINDSILMLERELVRLNGKLDNINLQLTMLRNDYKQVAKSKPGTCPTCGQLIPLESFTKTRDEKIASINQEGGRLVYDSKVLKDTIAKYQNELQTLQAELQQSHSQSNDSRGRLEAAFEKKLQLNTDIAELNKKINDIIAQEKKFARIEELNKQKAEFEDEIAYLNKQLNLIQHFDLSKVRLVEGEVNSKFQFITFKLFKPYETTGELHPDCEMLLDGKPYDKALSKGERFKADLDCLKTLQDFYGVQMPVFIDDSESYTSNSRSIDIPNQTFTLRVVEGQQNLKLEVIHSGDNH